MFLLHFSIYKYNKIEAIGSSSPRPSEASEWDSLSFRGFRWYRIGRRPFLLTKLGSRFPISFLPYRHVSIWGFPFSISDHWNFLFSLLEQCSSEDFFRLSFLSRTSVGWTERELQSPAFSFFLKDGFLSLRWSPQLLQLTSNLSIFGSIRSYQHLVLGVGQWKNGRL